MNYNSKSLRDLLRGGVMRKLASIKVISEILPIEGKDRIVLAIIDGWSVIVKKDEFKVGDTCVYCEIDSVLPEKEAFEFLRPKNFRIKTMKMGGVISQGICFPTSILPKGVYGVEQDVTDVIGIKQYEATLDQATSDCVKKATQAKYPRFLMRFKLFRRWVYRKDHREGKGFPAFISKTDETRIQNMPWVLSLTNKWVATEKIDGQSGTFVLVRRNCGLFKNKTKEEYIVCSRNLRLWNKDTSSYWSVSDRYKMQDTLRKMIGDNEWVAVQGECVAPNVQGNKYAVREADLYVFNVIYPTGRLDSVSAKNLCAEHGLKFVPILGEIELPKTVNEVLEYAHGQSQIGNTIREGVVFRSTDGKQSFKAVDPLFLIKYDE